jgi:zinc protease
LEKSVPELVPYVYELVQTATFPKEEIKNYLDVFSQKNTVNQGKVAWVARNEFTEILLGKDNSYCWKLTEAHFKEIDRIDLVEFYEKQYKNSTFQIYVSGKVSSKVIEAVKLTFSGKVRNANSFKTNTEVVANDSDMVVIEKGSSVQSAIRLGSTTINRRHKDFAALFIANTILGGYFGSRLMSNIREDKGYTYGIGSGVIHLNELSYFVISTEVGSDFTKKTLDEIEFEMNQLQQELVSSDELELVKNYILGNIMKGFDGSFSAMERFQMLNNHGLDYSYYENLIQKIKQVTPQQIKEVAKQYLKFNSLKKIIVGKL